MPLSCQQNDEKKHTKLIFLHTINGGDALSSHRQVHTFATRNSIKTVQGFFRRDFGFPSNRLNPWPTFTLQYICFAWTANIFAKEKSSFAISFAQIKPFAEFARNNMKAVANGNIAYAFYLLSICLLCSQRNVMSIDKF